MKKFFIPGNISLIFKICANADPAIAGSLGVGFTVNKGVEVSIQSAKKTEVFWNGEKIKFPTVRSVIDNVLYSLSDPEPVEGESRSQFSTSSNNKNITVRITSELPLGCGFGLSGASALGAAYAINDLFKLGKPKLELAKIAHTAEVENGTGLGDVVNEYYGGFLLKTVPSSQFKVQRIPISNTSIYVKYFSKISTKEIITYPSKREKIDKAGEKALMEVQHIYNMSFWRGAKATTPESPKGESGIKNQELSKDSGQARMTREKEVLVKILSISKQFAKDSGLLQDKNVIQTIAKIENNGGYASMIMLGNAVVSTIPFEESTELFIQ